MTMHKVKLKYAVDYAGVGGDGIDQYIIVNAKSRDEYIDPHGDRLAFPTENDAWDHIQVITESEQA